MSTTDEIDWGQFKGSADGDYPDRFKFENAGDSIVGTITKVKVARFDDGNKPELYVTTDEGQEWSVIAGQRQLQIKLAEARPASGDRIAIVFTGIENRGGGKTLKLFDVTVKRPDGQAAAPAAQPAAAAPSANDLI